MVNVQKREKQVISLVLSLYSLYTSFSQNRKGIAKKASLTKTHETTSDSELQHNFTKTHVVIL